MIKKGFSLIELLVVIAIISTLAAIAIPAYKQYSIRTAISTVMPVLHKLQTDLNARYVQAGVFPQTWTFNGITLPTNQLVTINSGYIGAMVYGPSPDGLGFGVAVVLQGAPINQIPGYVYGGTVHNNSTNADIVVGVRDVGNGATKFACGQWDSPWTYEYVPLSYLPKSCQCTAVYSFYTTGTGC